jgi:oligoribonuclease NrnB/cAMP/cGMP phosphodiesterase (DHH superfamily)
MNTILVLHHSADLDGLCSREVARKALGTTADYLGWDYGAPIPDTSKYSRVYLIDISFPPPEMLKLMDKLIWIDHHATAIKDNFAYYGGLRIDEVAACRLAYQWFFGDRKAVKEDYVARKVEEPHAVTLLGEHDVWDHHDDETLPFQYAMLAQKSPDWVTLLGEKRPEMFNPLIVKGAAIQDYLEVTNAQLANECGYDADFEDLKFRVINTPQKGSIQFDASIKEHHDGCLRYYWNGKEWGCSLYGVAHKKDIDLSAIAKKYGGGGHKSACGMVFKTLPTELGGRSQ